MPVFDNVPAYVMWDLMLASAVLATYWFYTKRNTSLPSSIDEGKPADVIIHRSGYNNHE